MGDEGFRFSTPGTHKGTIKAVTQPKEYESQMQIGFMLKEHEGAWFNSKGKKDDLLVLIDTILKKGNYVSYEMSEEGFASSFKVISKPEEEHSRNYSKEYKKDFIVKINGKDYVTYKGILDMAHNNGLQSIEILKSWVSEDMSRAWCISRVKFKDKFFDGFGSSTPENTGDITKTHPIEMSATRSSARALRNALNIGEVALEEMKENK